MKIINPRGKSCTGLTHSIENQKITDAKHGIDSEHDKTITNGHGTIRNKMTVCCTIQCFFSLCHICWMSDCTKENKTICTQHSSGQKCVQLILLAICSDVLKSVVFHSKGENKKINGITCYFHCYAITMTWCPWKGSESEIPELDFPRTKCSLPVILVRGDAVCGWIFHHMGSRCNQANRWELCCE